MSFLQSFTLLTITISNIFGIIPLYTLFNLQRYYGFTLVLLAVIASCFMHISETKHHLPGLLFKTHSNLLLNVDRFFAVITATYGIYLFWTNPSKTITMVIIPLIGLIANKLGGGR